MRLNPAVSASSPISISMFVHGLNESTIRYDALSYAWGDGTKSDVIAVNSYTLNITKNLQVALQHLRRQDGDIVLWVDGICINQENTSERNGQVAQMGKIFSNADRVRIWLGAESQTSGAAMRMLEGLDGVQSSEQIVHRVVADEGATQALTLLLQRPYWTRMWVFQEIVLAREATVHCGTLSAKWSTLRALDDAAGNPTWWQYPETHRTWVTGLRKAVFRISQFLISLPDAWKTINVLHSTRALLSTDPRDKLFALKGVSDMSHLLKADYSKPTRDVYMDFTRRLIRKDRSLEILLTAGPWNPQNGADIGLPSWTPDYRGMSGVDVRYLTASHLEHFNASKGSYHNHPRSDSLSGRDTLTVEGVILDTVGKIAFLGTGESRRHSVMEEFDPVRRHPRPRARHSFKDFFETMILYNATEYSDSFAETTGFEENNKSRLALGFLHDFNKFYRTQNPAARTGKHIDMTSVLHGARGAETFEQAVREYHDLWKRDPAALYWRWKEYVNRVEGATDGHLTNIFSTADGYLARGLSSIREGDIVTVLFGSRPPFVLRKAEESSTYQLISPCYVPGIMSGELMERVSENSSENHDGCLPVETLILV